ncbi:MAG: hypothetical protein U0X73_10145 [Thermoanaerobaculia bacterium]
MRGRKAAALGFVAAMLAMGALPAHAGEASKSVAFELDKWVDLGAKEGPVTLHRIRLAREGGLTKSKFMRPGNSEYLQDVQIQLEFSNEASADWKAKLHVTWEDADGTTIDGYNDSEGLDSDSKYDQVKVTLSTLRYGLERAKKLKIAIEFYPD